LSFSLIQDGEKISVKIVFFELVAENKVCLDSEKISIKIISFELAAENSMKLMIS
jgi:hypothetical protein